MLFWPHAKQPDVAVAGISLMRYLPITFVVAVLAAVLAGCGGSGGGSVPGGAVAKVGGTTITQQQFNDLIEQAKKSYKTNKKKFPPAGSSEYQTLKNQAVQYLVQRVEFSQEAEKLGVVVTDKDIAARLAQIKKQYFGGSESRYKKQLAQQGLSDAQAKKYYDDHQSQYGVPEQRVVAHILVKTKALADKLYDRVKAGEDFAKLAKQYSQDPGSKKVGGKLTISKGQTVGPFDQTAFLLAAGQVSRPVKTTFGYHIIKALGPIKQSKTTPFSKVKASIKQTLLQQKRNEAMTNWSNKLKKDFDGKVSYQTGYAPPATSTAATTTQ